VKKHDEIAVRLERTTENTETLCIGSVLVREHYFEHLLQERYNCMSSNVLYILEGGAFIRFCWETVVCEGGGGRNAKIKLKWNVLVLQRLLLEMFEKGLLRKENSWQCQFFNNRFFLEIFSPL
jgi:hypothetical protein